MANVKVAVRVRPPNAKEAADGGRLAVQVDDKFVRIQNVKLDGRTEHTVDSREKLLEFCFDYCYWSVHPEDPHYASQEEVFQDLGESVLAGASEGYNVCLFAYGQTGSGKTYTMMGTPDSIGLTPRICQGLFWSDNALPDGQNSSRVEISFLEIYNERVRDLLRVGEQKKRAALRVREHPEKGPYVQDLSQHVVSDSKQAMVLLEEGIANRITAATHNHDASSRSHAIFTIQYTQAILENNRPSETVSKINLVDLAGSERADHNYCRDRLTEGSNINKSLVTLGIVISALAQNSQMSSSCQSINSMASEGDKSTAGSHSSSLSRGGGRRSYFIPYRDSVLTWLLKDSLGGNSKTIMIATVSPSANSYNETLSTLRYAAHARNIINKPRVNEDANVRLIRELREEIDRLKSMLLTYELQRNPSPSLSDERDGALSEIVLQNELKVEQLMKDWSESWIDQKCLLQQYNVDINSVQPHLISLDRDALSTGIVFYNLLEGITRLGPGGQSEEPQIVLQGSAGCEIVNHEGVVTLRPLPDCICLLNEREINEPCRLAQGAVITLGGVHRFLFNHPTEAAVLREQKRVGAALMGVEGNVPCTIIDLCVKGDNHSVEKAKLQGQPPHCTSLSDQTAARQRVEQQQRYVESLLQDINCEQRKAEKELEQEQALLQQQHRELQAWIHQEKERLSTAERRATQELGVQTDLVSIQLLDQFSSFVAADQNTQVGICPSQLDREKKKVVNEELMKHHALCRAASRIHRSRLQFQLKRIANKRCMLEAKRELQRLEKALPSGPEGLDSAEFGSKCSGDSFALRRHSFTSDLLSRLHPHHSSRHALKGNQHTTSTTSMCSRTWVSDECLPRGRTQSCSGSLFSGQSQFCQDEVHLSANIPAKDQPPVPRLKCPERKPLLPNRDLTFKNWSNTSPSVTPSSPLSTAGQKTNKENSLSITKKESLCVAASPESLKTKCDALNSRQGTTEELSSSVRPKKNFSMVFRRPELSHEERGPTFLRRIMGRLHWRQRRGLGLRRKRTGSKCPMKSAVSCDDLDQRHLFQGFGQRRWHSTEALRSQTKRWVETQPELTGWDEEEKEVNWDEERSDCDSLFSLDSLSSTYAAALADQLKSTEDTWGCGAESEDSSMSKDSLTVVSRQKCTSMKKLSKALLPTPLIAQEVSPHQKYRKLESVLGNHGASALLSPPATDLRNSESGTIKITLNFPGKKSDSWSSPVSSRTRMDSQNREMLKDAEIGPQMTPLDSLGRLKHGDMTSNSKVFPSVPATSTDLNITNSVKAKERSKPLQEFLLKTEDQSSAVEVRVVRYESSSERHPTVKKTSEPPEVEIGKHPIETSVCSTGSFCATHSCTNSSEIMYDSGCCMKLPTDDHNPDDSAEDVNQYELPNDILLSGDEKLDEISHKCPMSCLTLNAVNSACEDTLARNKEEQQQAFTGSIGIPKRQNSKDVLTHCSTPAGTCNRVWLNVSDSSRDPEWDQTPVAIDDVSPDGRHDSLASVGLPVSDLISLKFVEVSNKPTTSEESFPSCKHGNKVHECTVATKEAPEKIKGIESYDSKPHHISQSQAICSAIDLRISEVVKEHVRLPVIGSNDERITHAGHRPFQSSTCPFCCDCDEHRRTDEQPKADSRVTSVCGHCSLDQNKQMITCNEIDHRMLSNAPAIKSVITDMKSNEPPNRLNDAKLLFKFHHESRDKDCGLSNAPKVGQEKEHLNLTKSRVCFKSAVKQSCCEASVLNPNSSHNLSATGVNSCGEFLDPSAAKEESSPEQGQNPIVMSDQLEKGNDEPQHNFPATNVNNDDKWSNVPQQEVDQRTNRKGVVGHDDLINQSEYVTHNQCKNGGKSCHGSDIAMIHSSGSTCGHSAPKIVRSRWSRRKSGSSHPSRSSCYDTSSDEQDDETPKHRRNSRPLSPNINPDLCISQPSFNDTVKSPKSRKKNPCISSNTRKRHCLRPKHSQKQVCERETDEGKAAVGSQESIMHFASSDINPFVHHRQDSSQQCNNTQAFGSAADLSCKSLLLNSTEKRIMRCCSADDGLNGQNSPFLSHLSTYANNKRLSSTLSSFEDCQVKKEFAQHKSNGSHCQGGETTARTKGSTGFSPSSSQVDEIMFLYSSETESNKTKAIRRTNECGSQTEYNWHRGLPLRGERHKRSVTEGAATKKVDIKETPTWASMESMSVHLSKLIDSTSDLLGDVQGMRTGGVCTSVNLPEINVSKRKLNSFTQTSTMDTSNPRTCSDCPRTHEVNVTVRVVGAEVFTVAQNRNGRHVVASRVTAKNENLREVELNSSTETPPVMSETNRERQVRCAPREGPLTEEPRNKRVSENTELGRRARFSNKDAHYTDRASSPIITVGSNTLTRPKVKHSNANYQKGNGSEAQLVYPYDQSSKEEWDISSLGIDPKPLESEISYPSPKKCFGSLPSSLGGYKETERSRGVYQDFNRSLTALFTQEDDIVSLAPSECNTDVLVNAQPIICVQTYPGCQTVPDDLPVHNKFTNWSGIPSEQTQTKMVGSGARRCSQLIERLRRERHQVLATVNMKPLTTEQTGANSPLKKDAGFREELQPQPQSPTKQQLYDRHRRSIEGLRQEREDRLQTSRRARSLSPRRHSRLAAQETCPSSTKSMTISNQHQDYLQPFHRKVMSNTRMQAPCGGEGQHPSVIEQLLQDYGRAQEEAKTEIARARERLRERTEQEKRSFLQQASHQAFRDEPKLRTRISNSTLCTGSSVSLSSGPTSGYNSGNTFQHGSRPVLTGQAMGFQEEEHEVSTCPSPCVKGQPSRLSAQDLTAPDPRRKGSFECSRYKDITCNLLDRIFAEVRLAAPGGLINLLKGEATAGWRYQGQERGVQSFYKPSSSPSVHSFLAAAELERPLESLWGVISQPSRTHVYHPTLSSVWTRPLDDSTQLVYMLTDSSFCHLDQPRDFCCISKAVRQGGLCVLAMQSVFEESLPRPCLDAVRAEMLPSCWLLQPVRRSGKEVTRIIGLLQVDLGFPSIPPHLLNTAAMQQASVISHLNSYLDTQL